MPAAVEFAAGKITLLDSQAYDHLPAARQGAAPANATGPGRVAGARDPSAGFASVRLAAQEGRDLELIVLGRVMHRGRTAMLVQALRHPLLRIL